jgi:hypothetical protein
LLPALLPNAKNCLLAAPKIPPKLLIMRGSPGWIRTSDHSINSRMLYR